MYDCGFVGMNLEMVWIVVISEQFLVFFEFIVIVIIIILESRKGRRQKNEKDRKKEIVRKRIEKVKGNDVQFINLRIE